jgi:hypothetical protein
MQDGGAWPVTAAPSAGAAAVDSPAASHCRAAEKAVLERHLQMRDCRTQAEGSVADVVERRFKLLSAPVRMSENYYCAACKLPAEQNRSCPACPW